MPERNLDTCQWLERSLHQRSMICSSKQDGSLSIYLSIQSWAKYRRTVWTVRMSEGFFHFYPHSGACSVACHFDIGLLQLDPASEHHLTSPTEPEFKFSRTIPPHRRLSTLDLKHWHIPTKPKMDRHPLNSKHHPALHPTPYSTAWIFPLSL